MIIKILSILALGTMRARSLTPLYNEAPPTKRSAEQWKRKTAMAIGKPELADAPDEELEKAHHEHMQAISDCLTGSTGSEIEKGMPPGPASVVGNEATRRGTIKLLVNEAVARGMKYEDAFSSLRNSRPDLFPMANIGGPTQEALRHIRNGTVDQAYQARREQAQGKIKDLMALGKTYEAAFAEVKRNFPHLFESPVETAKRLSKMA